MRHILTIGFVGCGAYLLYLSSRTAWRSDTYLCLPELGCLDALIAGLAVLCGFTALLTLQRIR